MTYVTRRPRTWSKKISVSMHLDAAQFDEINRLAVATNTSRSLLFRQALAEFLAKRESRAQGAA